MKNVLISQPLVSVEWLQKHINHPDVLVFDASIPKVTSKKDNNANLVQLPNAQFFDLKQVFSDASSNFPNTIPSEAQFQREARQLGVHKNSAIVVYDDKGIYSSARVWWLFKVFGFHNVAVLNGGLPEWKSKGLPTEEKKQNPRAKGDFEAYFNNDLVVYFEDLKSISEDKNTLILDARSSDRFQCKVPEPREGLRSGTIPNSKSLPFTSCLEDGKLRSKEDLQNLFKSLMSQEDSLVFSCGSGITACVLDLAASIAGYKNTRVYDGSWTEYGSLTKL